MKQIALLIFAFALITNCNRKKPDDENRITIKGKIANFRRGDSLQDARKVLVVDIGLGTLSTRFVDIAEGSFSYNSPKGVVTALIFLNEENKYIGTLSSQGLKLLPLFNLSEGDNTTIDLSTLTMVGKTVIPTHDPLGKEIFITESEIKSLKAISGYFESIAKNIDTNNDSIADVVDNKQLYIKTRFSFSGGQWGKNNKEPVLSESLSGYQLEVNGGRGFSLPSSIVLSGPAANPYSNINLNAKEHDGNGGFYAVFGRNPFLPFESGTYTLTIDGNAHTMDYTFIDPKFYLAYVVPTLHTNSDGKLVSVSLQYMSSDKTILDPKNLLTDVMLQFGHNAGYLLHESPKLMNENAATEGCECVKGLYTYTLQNPLDISELKNLSIGYNDLLGNTYLINWHE